MSNTKESPKKEEKFTHPLQEKQNSRITEHPTSKYSDENFDKLAVWIDQNKHESIGWSQLTQVSGLSINELSILFVAKSKLTPMQWIRENKEKSKSASRPEDSYKVDTYHFYKPRNSNNEK
jgi:hypothetical protein